MTSLNMIGSIITEVYDAAYGNRPMDNRRLKRLLGFDLNALTINTCVKALINSRSIRAAKRKGRVRLVDKVKVNTSFVGFGDSIMGDCKEAAMTVYFQDTSYGPSKEVHCISLSEAKAFKGKSIPKFAKRDIVFAIEITFIKSENKVILNQNQIKNLPQI